MSATLYTAFTMDAFVAYELFIRWQLHCKEPGNMYLAELQKLAVSFGRMSDHSLAYLFLIGLPQQVEWLLHPSFQKDVLVINQLLSQAQAITKDKIMEEGTVVAAR